MLKSRKNRALCLSDKDIHGSGAMPSLRSGQGPGPPEAHTVTCFLSENGWIFILSLSRKFNLARFALANRLDVCALKKKKLTTYSDETWETVPSGRCCYSVREAETRDSTSPRIRASWEAQAIWEKRKKTKPTNKKSHELGKCWSKCPGESLLCERPVWAWWDVYVAHF